MKVFKYNLNKAQVVTNIKARTYSSRLSGLTTDKVISYIKGDRVVLCKRRVMMHPLQRKFYGAITTKIGKTHITGGFRVPIINMIIFLIFTCSLVFANIQAVIDNFNEGIKISLLFLIMYSVLGAIFITGKTMFREQEDEVIALLNTLDQ